MKRPRARTLRRVVGVLALLVVVVTAWGGVELWRLVGSARAASDEQRALRRSVQEQDWAAAGRQAQRLADEAAAANDAAGSLPLTAASALPFVGDDLHAIRQTASASAVAASDVVVPLVAILEELTADLPSGAGGFPLERLDDAAAKTAPVARAAAQAAETMRGLPRGGLTGAVADPVGETAAGLRDLARRTDLLDRAVTALPAALGRDDPRQYLVAFQNLAEARPTGGIIGAWALIEMADGQASLTATGANDDLEKLSGPVRDLGAEVADLYGADLALSQNINLSPHFPQAALLLSDLWQAQGRPAPDGVISLDPPALAAMMQSTGGVRVRGGPDLTARNLVRVLLSDVYEIFLDRQRVRTAYLAQVTGQVFQQTLDSPLLVGSSVRRLATSAERGHVQVWSPVPAEQELFVDLGVAGELTPPTTDTIGAYVTNIDGSKLDYYLDVGVTAARACSGGLTLTVDLTNGAPPGLPDYVGNHLVGATGRFSHSVLLTVLLPPSRGLERPSLDSEPVAVATGSERGWTVVRTPVEVPPGATVTVGAVLTGVLDAPTRVLTQPLLRPASVDLPAGCTPGS